MEHRRDVTMANKYLKTQHYYALRKYKLGFPVMVQWE